MSPQDPPPCGPLLCGCRACCPTRRNRHRRRLRNQWFPDRDVVDGKVCGHPHSQGVGEQQVSPCEARRPATPTHAAHKAMMPEDLRIVMSADPSHIPDERISGLGDSASGNEHESGNSGCWSASGLCCPLLRVVDRQRSPTVRSSLRPANGARLLAGRPRFDPQGVSAVQIRSCLGSLTFVDRKRSKRRAPHRRS